MLTREQIEAVYEQGVDATCTLVLTMQEQHAAFAARVKELEDRLGKDSHNSSKPPSSDGFPKKPVSLRPSTGRKPGAQKGHPGKNLPWKETPDVVVEHLPTHCADCGHSLAGVTSFPTHSRQVVDLPPLALVTTQHRVHTVSCPHCQHPTCAAFPPEATQPVQYGPRLKALAVTLLTYHLLPYQRIASLLADLFGASFSQGSLFACQQSASTRLEETLAGIRQGLQGSPVAHFDETGLRVEGTLHWLHSASTATLTYYACHRRRGKEGMDAAGILPSFSGRAMHDGWRSYHDYSCPHSWCNAHHLRELTALFEQDKQDWAERMRRLLVEGKRAVEVATEQGQSRLKDDQIADLVARYRQVLAEGLSANPPPEPVPGKRGRPKQSRSRNLLLRLQQGEAETLGFLFDFAIPFDNNLAERDIRMVKVQQKVSGSFRREAGAEAFCRVRSYLSTMRKQGHSVLSALEHVFRGNPLCPQT